ncbi:hypothetical protein B9J09_10910 [Xylella fastidiosa subsp. pauca]|uniref:hypothetical protein n=1 Tax=Xylella fastidiosa TaxID=2371 RepID=UPI0005828360|nr:hypothetical protein [Xylella fastidiosa]ARO69447.1 hypothetical protein B9J09_10910 [Xylella fastidiosa subsp. pauca]AVI21466.1 hypothetical protein BCV75_10210 [Xylella fastidiosa]AVI23503.1 hypothetical protein BC375_10280 [Xylella fastidiosa]KIA58621.1 hypothetical protein RA12_03100 [Xylella fastidiosa]KXB10728.1 hypothetical protein ADT32_08220 [Xylella fastidiosa]
MLQDCSVRWAWLQTSKGCKAPQTPPEPSQWEAKRGTVRKRLRGVFNAVGCPRGYSVADVQCKKVGEVSGGVTRTGSDGWLAHQVLEIRKRGRIGETAIRERLGRRLQHQCDVAACGGMTLCTWSIRRWVSGRQGPFGGHTDAKRLDMVM